MNRRAVLLGMPLAACAACWGGANYGDANPGRVAITTARAPRACDAAGRLRIVSYNIAFSRRIDRAIAVLRDTPALANADVVLLQEMDSAGTARIADALGHDAVYYPAIRSRRSGRDFGNAVLTRCAIVSDARLVLPYRSRYAGTQRIAVAATIRVGARDVRVYSVHLGTAADVSAGQRRAQLDLVLADAASHALAVVAGDMNTSDVAGPAEARGFAWFTRDIPRTTRFGRWDHVFARGVALRDPASVGVAAEGLTASDHAAVWAVVRLAPTVPSPRDAGAP